ncbi:O-succinylhomoserine sulfhydrylase [Alysiella crassa]|uniref:O-succinylhomoserine sulfhydrylase n=1 Tax=Alysiella crassa TaxID=153491 RepID=A0A376BT78_9NEIS|nr:O-succinylhomoserine sulfhydrylase [Alysiella crassa]UOP05772.1 O-succinylhomoserine sulfhydrylase [Alysiella crassa]UOP08100.1 O-succinylhomoserine sulfhydrylase [Alysiella crassa]SSY80182.1 O-succinylhomoserine sulfhydrylase [Alysiella crassa]
MTHQLHPQTLAIRGSKEQTAYNEHHQALFLTSSFMFDNAADGAALFAKQKQGYTYSRTANPTVAAFQTRIAQLERAQAGIATATGMAAIQAALLTFLSAGDHLISSRSLFGTTAGFITGHLMRFGIQVTFVSQTDVSEWEKAIQPNTKMLFLETPSNPLGEVADLEALAKLSHKNNALLAVDNCFCSSAVQQPLKFGADLSIQSATKAIDGQGRVLGGIVCGNVDLVQQMALYVNSMGISLSPFNAWVLLSGTETMMLRVREQNESALKIAQYLQKHAKIKQVYYSGLPENPQADLVQKQQSGGGAVLAFEVYGGQAEAWKVIDSVQIFSKTANFGDVRSTITHPYTTTHGRMSPEDKAASGIGEGLIRVAIGLEYVDDLIWDLEQALAA